MIVWEKLSNFADINKAHPVPHERRVPPHLTPSRGSSYTNMRKAAPFQVSYKSVPYAPPPTGTYSDVINIGLPPRGRDLR